MRNGASELQNYRIAVIIMEEEKIYIRDFWELDVYQRLYKLSIVILTKLLPKMPLEEKWDLSDQMRRACKSAPAQIAEGFPKRFQHKNWQKYLTDAIGECDEMIHHLSTVRDAYVNHILPDSCQILINQYLVCIKQLNSLGKSWNDYHNKN